ncbi:hypothetical protein ACF0H5_023735 [Mactra antiquata]
MLTSELLRTESLSDGESDNDDTVNNEPIVSACTITEAMAMLPKLKELAIQKGHSKLLSTVMELVSDLDDLKCSSMTKQTRINDFFRPKC